MKFSNTHTNNIQGGPKKRYTSFIFAITSHISCPSSETNGNRSTFTEVITKLNQGYRFFGPLGIW